MTRAARNAHASREERNGTMKDPVELILALAFLVIAGATSAQMVRPTGAMREMPAAAESAPLDAGVNDVASDESCQSCPWRDAG